MERSSLIHGPRVATRQLANEVYDRLTQQFIFSGDVPPGELLPSETKLAAHYGVSRVTIRSALRMLQDSHLIRIRNGIGSVVLPRPAVVTEGLDKLCSLETYAREHSQEIGTTDLDWSEEEADDEAAAKLELEAGAPVYVVHRVKLFGDVRVAWGIERVPADVLPLSVLKAEFVGSVMDVLLAHTDLGIEYADAELTPAAAPAAIARRLGVKNGTVCQTLEQIMYAGGRPIQWGKAWLLPEHYRLQVRRRVTHTAPVVRQPEQAPRT
ncbi:MAG: GntR family transcriptional regulator [Thermoleophilaceae bacterium]|jgi:GntR family transcriptional regulator|nr:GntR family transcriptional regulator [Thermoleophilaceae bacterium]